MSEQGERGETPTAEVVEIEVENTRSVLANLVSDAENAYAADLLRCVGRARLKLTQMICVGRLRDPRGFESMPFLLERFDAIAKEITETLRILGLSPGQDADRRAANLREYARRQAAGEEP